MKNKAMQSRLATEVLDFIHSRKSLQLASLGADGAPYASYAPFAIGDDCLYVQLSEIAVHAVNLQRDGRASVLILEDDLMVSPAVLLQAGRMIRAYGGDDRIAGIA